MPTVAAIQGSAAAITAGPERNANSCLAMFVVRNMASAGTAPVCVHRGGTDGIARYVSLQLLFDRDRRKIVKFV